MKEWISISHIDFEARIVTYHNVGKAVRNTSRKLFNACDILRNDNIVQGCTAMIKANAYAIVKCDGSIG